MIGYNSGAAPYPYITGWFPNGTEPTAHFAATTDAIQEGVRELLMQTEVIGGDLLIKRAHQAFISGAHADPNVDPTNFTDLVDAERRPQRRAGLRELSQQPRSHQRVDGREPRYGFCRGLDCNLC